jgi:predicted metal-dependent hydrolase
MTELQTRFTYAGNTVPYSVRFTRRTTLEISVLPDGDVEVVAPLGAGPEAIEAKLRKRGKWILAQQRYFSQFRPRAPERRYVGGETHLYLGRQYRLKLSAGTSESIKLKGGYFCVETNDVRDGSSIRSLLQGWYRAKAEIKLTERYAAVAPKFRRFIGEVPPLSLRPMRRRWGSFSRSGRITLNTDLIRAPTACIDYVVAHELAHAVHPHHGKPFYELFETIMPDWVLRKSHLERILA